MSDLLITISAVATVGVAMLPLIGAQKRSLVASEALVKQAVIMKAKTDNKDDMESIDCRVRFSRSWLLSFILAILGPFFAFKQGFTLRKRSKPSVENDEVFMALWMRTIFYSNPITVSVAIFLTVVGLGLGMLCMFTLLSLWSITAQDSSKLNHVNQSPSAYRLVTYNLASVMDIYKHLKFSH